MLLSFPIRQHAAKNLQHLITGNKVLIQGLNTDPVKFFTDHFDKLPADCDTVLYYALDCWNLWDNKEIFQHPNIVDKKFFLIGQGYQNRQLNANQFEIASHAFYCHRELSPMQIKAPGFAKGFGCLNNRASFARLLLGYTFWRNGLLKDIVFSQGITDAWWTVGLETPTIVKDIPDFSSYLQLLPIVSGTAIPPDFTVDHTAYTHAYCNIVTESEVGDDIYQTSSSRRFEVITEKSFKPFISCQIPLILGCAGHVRCLRNFGFEMMEDLLPADFDSSDSHARIAAIAGVVSQGTEYIENFYFDHLREIKHNYELISSDKVDQQISNNIKNFIKSLDQ